MHGLDGLGPRVWGFQGLGVLGVFRAWIFEGIEFLGF